MPIMNSIRKLEERTEPAVISELRLRPLYALELHTALGENKDAVRGAVERLDAAGLIRSPRSGARFELV